MAMPFSGMGGVKRAVKGFFDFPDLEQYQQAPADPEQLRGFLSSPVRGYDPYRAAEDFIPGFMFGEGLMRGNPEQMYYGAFDLVPGLGLMAGSTADLLKKLKASKYWDKAADAPFPYALEMQPRAKKLAQPKPRKKPRFYGYPRKTKPAIQRIEDRMLTDLENLTNPTDFRWYRDFGDEVRTLTDDPKQHERIARVAAVLSADAPADYNVRETVRAASEIARGNLEPLVGRYPNVSKTDIQRYLEQDIFGARRPYNRQQRNVGRKLESFHDTLLAAIKGERLPDVAVIDRHQLRFGGWGRNKKISVGELGEAEYQAQVDMLRRVLKRYNQRHGTNHTLADLQAAAWHAQKRKDLGLPANAAVPRASFTDPIKESLAVLPVETGSPGVEAAQGAGQYWDRIADPYLRTRMARAVETAVPPESLLSDAGLPLAKKGPGQGAYEGAVNPNTILEPAVPRLRNTGPFQTELLDAANAATRRAYLQDAGVAWMREKPSGAGAATQGFAFKSGRDYSDRDIAKLQSALTQEFGVDPGFTVVKPGEIHIVNGQQFPDFDTKVTRAAQRANLGGDLVEFGTEHSRYFGGHNEQEAAQAIERIQSPVGRPSLQQTTDRARRRVAGVVESITGRSTTTSQIPRSAPRLEEEIHQLGLARGHTVRARHYGPGGITVIDPHYQGTNPFKLGAEQRGGGGLKPRAKSEGYIPRQHYYVLDPQIGGGVKQRVGAESNLRRGKVADVTLENVYNLDIDPSGFRALAEKIASGGGQYAPDAQETVNVMEHLIRQTGHKGFQRQGIVNYFEAVPIK